MSMKKILLTLPLALTLSGCIIVADRDGDWDNDNNTSNWRSVQKQNRAHINGLNIGDARSEVLTTMGDPAFSEAFTKDNGSAYQILFYRTQHEHGDGETTKDETTALVFENDKLVGWGADALQRLR